MFYKNGKVLSAGILLLFLAASTLTVVANVQPPETEWEKTFGGSNTEYGRAVQQTSDGGYIITGWTASYGAGGRDAWLVKADANGNMEWNQTYGGTADEFAYSGIQTSDGGYIIVGETRQAGPEDVYLIKTDAKGNKIWEKTYGGGSWDKGTSIQQTTDGGYIIGGDTASFGVGGWYDFWLIKTDSEGNKQWDKTFGGSAREHSWSVQQTSDGGYIITGFTDSYGAGKGDFYLVKTDADGNLEWEKTFGGSEDDKALSVVQTSDGGYIITGYTHSYGAGSADFWLIKTDSDGNVQWNQTYGGTSLEEAFCLVQTSDGGYIITGRTESYGAGGCDAWLVKTDANGNMEWNQTYGGTADEFAYSGIQTSDGGYIITGTTESYGAGGFDVYLIKEAPPVSWEYVFEDERRGTTLKISTEDKYFQFIAPDKKFSVKHDPDMIATAHFIFISYEDSELKLITLAVDTKLDFCFAYAKDVETGQIYWLVDWLCGDIDLDLDVDSSDFYIFAGNYLTSPPVDPLCDLDGDNDCDSSDFYVFAGNYLAS